MKAWLQRAWLRWESASRRDRTALALAFQVAAFVALACALVGVAGHDRAGEHRVLVLLDRSDSVPRAAADAAVSKVVTELEAHHGADVQVLEFAGKPGASASKAPQPAGALVPEATNLEAALDAALVAHARQPFEAAVIVSDGWENAGDAQRGLRAVHDARLPVRWIGVARDAPPARIDEVLAPARVLPHQPILITVQLAGRVNRSLRATAVARAGAGEPQQASGEPDAAGRVTLAFEARQAGGLVFDVVLEDRSSGQRLDALADAAAVDVAPGGQLLYVRGSPGSLWRSLQDGGWSLDVVGTARLDALADRLDGYRAVVLDDVAIGDASPRFWHALVEAVQKRALGLMVLGGERSFDRGGYRGSELESILPVVSEPAALVQPVSVAFVVDKSGSMGRQSGGVDRFGLAQRAVLETAGTLDDRDALSFIVFDVAASVLLPLTPVPQAKAALARDWPVTPHGGTQAAPAIVAAIDELERSDGARRMLVLVTDGFLDTRSVTDLRARLARARIETIALAVGPDADVSALEALVGPGGGVVLRVGEAAELPLAMRTTLERRRARIERGTIGVTQREPLPFAQGLLRDWPAIAAYPVTRSRGPAVAAVQSERGDPLIAFRASGLGRVVAVTCGLGPWSPAWLGWREWPRLAGGLTEWIGGAPGDGSLGVAISDGPLDIEVEADARSARGWADDEAVAMAVTTPAGKTQVLPAQGVAPGRLRATLPDQGAGLYTFAVSSPLGTQRVLHLRRHRGETHTWGINPAVDAWRRAGLVDSAREDAGRARATDARRQPDPSLVALALVLFVAGVLTDRAQLPRARGLLERVKQWWARATIRRRAAAAAGPRAQQRG
jgi:hypothetical protein